MASSSSSYSGNLAFESRSKNQLFMHYDALAKATSSEAAELVAELEQQTGITKLYAIQTDITRLIRDKESALRSAAKESLMADIKTPTPQEKDNAENQYFALRNADESLKVLNNQLTGITEEINSIKKNNFSKLIDAQHYLRDVQPTFKTVHESRSLLKKDLENSRRFSDEKKTIAASKSIADIHFLEELTNLKTAIQNVNTAIKEIKGASATQSLTMEDNTPLAKPMMNTEQLATSALGKAKKPELTLQETADEDNSAKYNRRS